jgi:hypothetical protein
METQRVLYEVEAARRVDEGSPIYLGLYIPGLGPDRSLSSGYQGFRPVEYGGQGLKLNSALNAVVYLQRS